MDSKRRERTGSFYSPKIWVELSQKYLADTLGENWQDEYYIWDCAAGTGNLLAGLTNKFHIWASTLDRQDVDVMKDRIKNGANLLENHVFQFDFLNDDFSKLPKNLQNVINDPKKRKKLVIYINPPYAEASNKKTLQSRKQGNRGVEQSKINEKYARYLGQGNAELFAQFLTRIYFELQGVTIAHFSKLKILTGQHFINFRQFFLAKLQKSFAVSANTFDNVKGQFPIGFMIWNTDKKEKFEEIIVDIYDKDKQLIDTKSYFAYDDSQYINDWIKPFRASKEQNGIIGKFPFKGNDFQNQNLIQIVQPQMEYNVEAGQFLINQHNLIQSCIYFAVRKCIPATWLNDVDQFLYPNNGWEIDTDFQNDCLAYTLFTNNIQSKYGTNHWIPFTEYEIDARAKFESNFMAHFISGKLKHEGNGTLLDNEKPRTTPLVFSAEAQAVFEAGKALWTYYHKVIKEIPLSSLTKETLNASFYDIRAFFQGRNEQGKMNNKSEDETYNELLDNLRDTLKILAQKIEPKVYEYGFLKR
ncbi:MAG: hypothetical protein MUE81_21915 [Thermoflexibacter sp.]|nr:hypothetical protein [Thermoflexibacter sp.]